MVNVFNLVILDYPTLCYFMIFKSIPFYDIMKRLFVHLFVVL